MRSGVHAHGFPERKSVRVLVVPADADRPLEVTEVFDSARAFSDAMGGCVLDDATVGELADGDWFTLYLPEGDVPPRSANPRAAALAARLGLADRQVQARLHGPILIAGFDPDTGADLAVPAGVLTAAEQAGLTVRVATP